MKAIALTALILTTSGTVGLANETETLLRSQSARFAAMSLTKDQGMRATVSNVIRPANDAHLTTCPVQIQFFGADGSLIGETTTVQLKPGESASVSASNPSKLARAAVTIDDLIDGLKPCLLKTSVEIFDVQTGMTFVSTPGETLDGNSDRGQTFTSAVRSDRKNATNRKNSNSAASSLRSGGAGRPKATALVVTPALATPR